MVRFATGRLKPSPGIYQGVQSFYHALAEGRPVPVPPEEGRRVMAWIATASGAADLEKTRRLQQQTAQPLAPARVLVTGGGGFLGSALVERLREQGEPIRLLLRRPPKPGSPRIRRAPAVKSRSCTGVWASRKWWIKPCRVSRWSIT